MNDYGWGLTSIGFRRPTYTELLDALEYKARELWGATANLTVRSPLGLFLRIYAWMLNILFSVLEDVYNSRFVDTAVGASLLNLGRAIGLRVLSAQKATGYLTVTGPPGTIIPEGWLAETAAGIQFFAVAETEIKADGTALVPARCTNTGPEGNVEAGTVTTITNPGAIAGITGVTNAAAFTGGRERETDDEFRDRYYRLLHDSFYPPRSLLRCGGQKLLGHHRMRVDCRVRRRDCVLSVEIEERKQGQIRPAFPHEIRR